MLVNQFDDQSLERKIEVTGTKPVLET